MKNLHPKVCIKTGKPVAHEIICKMCHRRCPHAGRKGRRRSSSPRRI